MVIIERLYEANYQANACTVFVDRLWPRGLAKKDALWNEWLREVAPTPALRKWFNHDPEKWNEFKFLYWRELQQKPEEINQILQLEKKYNTVVLLYAARDKTHNHALVLKEFIEGKKTKNQSIRETE